MRALTGCTVILCPPRTVASCDVRGNSPGSRELMLLAPERRMQEVHAVLFTGGSAFGLAAADGVMKYLEEQNIGYQTPWVKVPMVPAAVIFDLNIGSKDIRPMAESGYAAAVSAQVEEIAEGTVGAGTGATVGKWAGMETRMKGGIGLATVTRNNLIVTALAVANSVGDVIDDSGRILAGARAAADGRWCAEIDRLRTFAQRPSTQANTTLVAVLTNAALSKVDAYRVAQRGHDGMARAVTPTHTSYDGDVVFTLAAGPVEAEFELVASMSESATATAIRNAVTTARSVEGARSCNDT